MKPKTLILMVVAVGCGLAASYMTSIVLADRGNTTPELEKVAVLVAKQNIPMSTLIKEPEKFFEEKQYIKGEEPKKGIKSFDQLRDRRLNKPLSAEQFVSTDDVHGKDQGGLPEWITPGMRAVALKVNADSGVGGFVQPLSHVDIISVIQRNEKETYSKIILQNVLVLAVDQADRRPDEAKAQLASTVTVEVSPAQAEKLSLAQQLGTLRLTLRSFGDTATVKTIPVTPEQINKGEENSQNRAEDLSGNEDPRPTPVKLIGPIPDPPTGPVGPVVVTKTQEPPPPKKFVQTLINGKDVTKAVFIDQEAEAGKESDKTPSSSEPKTNSELRPAPTKKS